MTRRSYTVEVCAPDGTWKEVYRDSRSAAIAFVLGVRWTQQFSGGWLDMRVQDDWGSTILRDEASRAEEEEESTSVGKPQEVLLPPEQAAALEAALPKGYLRS